MLNTMQQMPAASSLALEAARVRPSYAGLAACQALSAPKTATHGITVPAAGFTGLNGTADVDVQGSPPREAPV